MKTRALSETFELITETPHLLINLNFIYDFAAVWSFFHN